MQQRRSQIFDNYAKIALEQGLIKQSDAMTQEDKYSNKEWKDTIQALYGIETKLNDKDDDALDQAHPEKVIISPSYDKINGLVENLKERSDVMKGIAVKPTNGNLLKHKYAQTKQNLLKELIQLGFKLDNKDETELMKLTDSCSDRLTKNAILPFIPIAMGGVALVAAFIAIINHTSPSDQGVIANTEKAVIELSEASEKLPQIRTHLNKLLGDLRDLQKLALEYNNLGGIDARDAEKFVHAAKNEQDKFNVVQRYKKACDIMSRRIPQYIQLIKSFKPQEDRSYDWWEKLKDLGRVFVPTDTEDATLALETLQKSLVDSVKEANVFMQQAREQEPTLMAVLSKEMENKNQAPESAVVKNVSPDIKPEAMPTSSTTEADELNKAIWSM